MKEQRKAWVAYPLLVAAFPVIFLYGQNVNEVSFGAVLPPLLIITGAVAVFWLLLRPLLGWHRSAVIAAGLTFLFFSYGQVFPFVDDRIVGDYRVQGDVLLMPLWGLLAIAVVAAAIKLSPATQLRLTKVVNSMAAAMLIVAAVPVVTYAVSGGAPDLGTNTGPKTRVTKVEKRPDIYYIMPDRYGGPGALDKTFAFDNSSFLSFLERKGFYVADEASSNYPDTTHSVAASMNMEYLDDLAARVGADSKDWKPLYEMIKHSEVVRFLKAHDYDYVHLGSWWDGTRDNPEADINYTVGGGSEFTQVLFDSSAMRPISVLLGMGEDRWDGRRIQWRRAHEQFELLATVDTPGPTFTYAHILSPHYPFAFGPDGSYVTEDEELDLGWEESYRRQVRFVNGQLRDLVQRLLDRPAAEQPIIIIQADEGAHPIRAEIDESFSWVNATDDELETKFPIMSAVYLPDRDYEGLYPSITPVNQFRFLFDKVFDQDLGLLADDNYVYQDGSHVYRFLRVTDRLPVH